MTIKEWIYKKEDKTKKSLIDRILSTRGIKTEEDIKEFLNPLEMKITQPEAFCDIPKAVERISKAIENNEKICIYGDFDADGVTSTSLLYKTLKYLGADVSYFIPDREKEGHGLATKALIKLMTVMKPKLIITVDCGISNVEEVKFIKSFNFNSQIDVIITDHHEAPEILPEAYAIINPKSPNSLDAALTTRQIKFLTSLAGVGVAFKLAQAVLNFYNKPEFIIEILPYVAVGTIADVVPLIGENRYFVLKGLELISKGKHYGIKRLIESAGYSVEKGLTAENIAFGVAPRINASGRLETVESSMKLLISENNAEIEMAVQTLNELNVTRQRLCKDTFEQADEMLKKEGNKNPAIILFNKEWQAGIIGIVASKLVEKYYKPTFLMTYSEELNLIKCSARSIEGIHLYEVISEISELLDGFGGHSMAAGLSFSPDKTPFETVKEQLNKTIKEVTNGKQLKPFLNIDMELTPDEISVELVEELSKLEPFGAANPAPVFSISNNTLKQKQLMGENKNHLKLTVENGGKTFTCIRWQDGDIRLNPNSNLDIAFHPQINEFNGNISVQLIVDDIHSPELKEEEPETVSGIKIYDHRQKTDILQQVNDYVETSKLNIKIFAESKTIKDKLSGYRALTQNSFTRENIPPCDALMLFDYPADRKTFEYLIKNSSPRFLHLMNYDIHYSDDTEFIKTIIGMIKFACNNNNGHFDLIRCAGFLAKSTDVITKLLDLFEVHNIISIEEKSSTKYKIKFKTSDNINSLINNSSFAEITNLAEECELFQKSLLEDNIEDIDNLCNMII